MKKQSDNNADLILDCDYNSLIEEKENFAIGRRINQYYTLSDMDIDGKRKRVTEYVNKLKEEGVDASLACNMLRSQMI